MGENSILDHFESPYHRGEAAGSADRSIRNPACGDELTLQLTIQDGQVGEAWFTAVGCMVTQIAVRRCCSVIPGLSGYVGFDVLIPDEADAEPPIVDINPRLTTGYLLWRKMCADNLAAGMLSRRMADVRHQQHRWPGSQDRVPSESARSWNKTFWLVGKKQRNPKCVAGGRACEPPVVGVSLGPANLTSVARSTGHLSPNSKDQSCIN